MYPKLDAASSIMPTCSIIAPTFDANAHDDFDAAAAAGNDFAQSKKWVVLVRPSDEGPFPSRAMYARPKL